MLENFNQQGVSEMLFTAQHSRHKSTFFYGHAPEKSKQV